MRLPEVLTREVSFSCEVLPVLLANGGPGRGFWERASESRSMGPSRTSERVVFRIGSSRTAVASP